MVVLTHDFWVNSFGSEPNVVGKPEGVAVRNPAFDVTPHRYVSAIITENGIARDPYTESLARIAALPFNAENAEKATRFEDAEKGK